MYGIAERQNERIVRSTFLCILFCQEDVIVKNSSAWQFLPFDKLKKKNGSFIAYKFRFHFEVEENDLWLRTVASYRRLTYNS